MNKYLIFVFTVFSFINLSLRAQRARVVPTRSACEEFYLYGRDCSSGCVVPKEVYCRMEYPDIFERGQNSQTSKVPTRVLPVIETARIKYLDYGPEKAERDVSHYLLANSILKMSNALQVFPGDVLEINQEYAKNYFREKADELTRRGREKGINVALTDNRSRRVVDGKHDRCTVSFKKINYDPRTVEFPKYVEIESVDRNMMTPRLFGGSDQFYSCNIETRLNLKSDIFDYVSCTEYGARNAAVLSASGCSFEPTSKKQFNFRLQWWVSL